MAARPAPDAPRALEALDLFEPAARERAVAGRAAAFFFDAIFLRLDTAARFLVA